MREGLQQVLPERVRRRSWKANFTSAVNSGVAGDLASVVSLLARDSLGVRMGYLDPGRLPAEVAALSEGLTRADCTDSWDLADLFGFEVWLQVFFHDRAAHVPFDLGRT